MYQDRNEGFSRTLPTTAIWNTELTADVRLCFCKRFCSLGKILVLVRRGEVKHASHILVPHDQAPPLSWVVGCNFISTPSTLVAFIDLVERLDGQGASSERLYTGYKVAQAFSSGTVSIPALLVPKT